MVSINGFAISASNLYTRIAGRVVKKQILNHELAGKRARDAEKR